MAERKEKINSMIFEYETTAQAEYQTCDPQPYIKTLYKEKITSKDETSRKKASVKYVHSLSEWNGAPVAFDLLTEPKPIVRTNPHHLQAPYEKLKDLELDEVRKTRPRYIISPAVAIDDVEDPQSRKILIDSSYTTNMMSDYIADQRSSVKAPLNGTYAATRPLTLPNCKPYYVSPEWRWETLKWEAKQLRSYCDSTKEFWLRRRSSRDLDK